MDLDLVNDVDPIKAAFVVFLAGILTAILLYIYNTQVSPVLRSTLQPKVKSA